MIAVMTGGQRIRETFKTREEAETRAAQLRIERQNMGAAAFAMPVALRVEAAKCVEKLQPYSASLTEAVDHYIERVLKFREAPTVADAVKRLLVEKEQKNLRVSTLRDLRHRWEKFAETFGARKLNEITGEELAAWLVKQAADPVNRHNYRRKIGTLYRLAVKRKWTAENIVEQTERPEMVEAGVGILRVESFSIEGRKNVMISTNNRLRVKLDSDAGAWGRRMLIVDYARPKPTKPIPGFDSILLREEGEGILRWAVEGAIQLKKDLDATGTMQLTEAQRRRVDDLLSESDSVRSFVRERIEQHHGSEIAIHELTATYRDYCEARDWGPLRDRQFQAELPDAMLEYHRATKRNDIPRDGKSVRGFRGVRLQTGSERPSELQGQGDEHLPFSDGSDDHREIIPREQDNDRESIGRNDYITSEHISGASEPMPATTAKGGDDEQVL